MKTKNIYGLSARDFKLLKMQYDNLPADKKAKIAEAEQKAFSNAVQATEEKLVAAGWEKIDDGKLLLKPKEKENPCKHLDTFDNGIVSICRNCGQERYI